GAPPLPRGGRRQRPATRTGRSQAAAIRAGAEPRLSSRSGEQKRRRPLTSDLRYRVLTTLSVAMRIARATDEEQRSEPRWPRLMELGERRSERIGVTCASGDGRSKRVGLSTATRTYGSPVRAKRAVTERVPMQGERSAVKSDSFGSTSS